MGDVNTFLSSSAAAFYFVIVGKGKVRDAAARIDECTIQVFAYLCVLFFMGYLCLVLYLFIYFCFSVPFFFFSEQI